MVFRARETGEIIMADYDYDSMEESPKGLREQLKKEQARRKEAESQLIGLTLKDLGLSSTEGLGKAVTKLYDGPIDKDSISQFVADEFNYVANQKVSEQPVETKANKTEQVIASEQRVQQLNQISTPNESENILDAFNEVMGNSFQSGDVRSSLKAKLQMMEGIAKEEKNNRR